jgi:hypothetical protein
VLGTSCIVTPIRLLKRRHHPLLRTNCRKITISLINRVVSAIAVITHWPSGPGFRIKR